MLSSSGCGHETTFSSMRNEQKRCDNFWVMILQGKFCALPFPPHSLAEMQWTLERLFRSRDGSWILRTPERLGVSTLDIEKPAQAYFTLGLLYRTIIKSFGLYDSSQISMLTTAASIWQKQLNLADYFLKVSSPLITPKLKSLFSRHSLTFK